MGLNYQDMVLNERKWQEKISFILSLEIYDEKRESSLHPKINL